MHVCALKIRATFFIPEDENTLYSTMLKQILLAREQLCKYNNPFILQC